LALVQTYTVGSSSIGTSYCRIDGTNTPDEGKFMSLSSQIFFTILVKLKYRIKPSKETHGHELFLLRVMHYFTFCVLSSCMGS